MNKKDFIQSTKIIILAIMIAMGTSYALGTDWYEPGLLTNSPEVVNLGTAYQEKAGAFSANGLSSWADGYFFSDLKVGGTGASDADANLKVSGKVGINLDESEVTTPSTTLDVNGSVRARSLSLTENPGTTYAAQVCADADGKLVICPIATGEITWSNQYSYYSNSTGSGTFPSPTNDFRPVAFGYVGGIGGDIGTYNVVTGEWEGATSDGVPGYWMTQEVRVSGAWQELLPITSVGTAGQSCDDFVDEIAPLNTSHRVRVNYDNDWSDPTVSGSEVFKPGACVYQKRVI